jgi:flagellar biogenesis protein FliO
LGVFANAISSMASQRVPALRDAHEGSRGLAGWLLERLHRRSFPAPRLSLVERINLGPRQTLALIEADGQRLLVATSPESAPVFYALKAASSSRRTARSTKGTGEGKSA